ncbi:MAG: ArsA-related P-loop ATPase [Actinomycetota bacterium]
MTPTSVSPTLAAAVEGRRVVVSCGSGGVGKTTVSAAVALGLAARGARTAVVTIDPARRLASALAIGDLDDTPRRVPADLCAAAGYPLQGELWALQLDPTATFDRLVARHAPTAEARDRILGNRIYRYLSGPLSGAHEYMAVERLHELMEEERFDCVVLDTPPAANALDFLDAPERITRFIEGRALRMLLRPGLKAGRTGLRALHAGGSLVLSLLERLTGGQLLREVSDFLMSFEGMYEGFRDRAGSVRGLLKSPQTAFVVVTGTHEEPIGEAVALWRRLQHDGYPLGGIVLNRYRPLPEPGPARREDLAAFLGANGATDPDDLARRVAEALEEQRLLALRDLDAREAIRKALGDPPVIRVADRPRPPVELAGLASLTRELLG